MKNRSYFVFTRYLTLLLTVSCWNISLSEAQTQVEPWGNIKGIRIEGQLMPFESSLRVTDKDWHKISATAKEKQRPQYHRENGVQMVTTKMDSLYFHERVRDTGTGKTAVNITLTSSIDTLFGGAWFAIALSEDPMAALQINGRKEILLKDMGQSRERELVQGTVSFHSSVYSLLITPEKPLPVMVRKEDGKYILYLAIKEGGIKKNETYTSNFLLEASGNIDKRPVALQLNTARQGRLFAGFGGNFRIQNLKTDPQVIDYSLQHLRLAWGRVEMPWRYWKDSSSIDPHVQRAMEMAQKLAKKHIPVILTAWSAPDWAIEGKPNFRPTPAGIWGNPLDQAHIEEIYSSITSYIFYLKQHYGVEVEMFSFNESDLGINIRQTGEEHAKLIRELGAYFRSKGLKTRMLLGDNSDATTYSFIGPASTDPVAKPFIGAVSFHSWRGWETSILEQWASAASRLKIPLIVGEGSIDAAAWNYPAVFAEPSYALQEIDLYTRLLAICQPLTILQWQLTADYSPLAGGGIFGDNGPLRPTQRWWNLKQLSSTPKGLYAVPVTRNLPNISAAALGNQKTGVYCLHLVNNGASRTITVNGFPKRTKTLKIFVTGQKQTMSQGKQIPVKNGTAVFTLEAQTYTTLITG